MTEHETLIPPRAHRPRSKHRLVRFIRLFRGNRMVGARRGPAARVAWMDSSRG